MSWNDYLAHHGIIGQRWGIKNGPPYPIVSANGSHKNLRVSNLTGARYSNIDKFGKDAEHNILWITGLSGSGKSTTTLELAGKNDDVIHLDLYSEGATKDIPSKTKRFDSYLESNYKGLKERIGTKAFHSKEYWDSVDEFVSAIKSFSIREFKNGNRVFVEGVQIADDWISDDNSFYAGQPMLILGTSSKKSMRRAAKRDGIKLNQQKAEEWISNQNDFNKRLDKLATDISAERGRSFLKDFLADM